MLLCKPVAIGDLRRTTPAVAAIVAIAVLMTATAPTAAHARPTGSAPELSQGAGMGAAASPAVKRVQRALTRRGYGLGAAGTDGRFGPITDAAVRRLQADRGLAVDGIVGRHTRAALQRTVAVLAQGAGMGARPSPAVKRVQRALTRAGYRLGPTGIDGRFGPITDAAVRRLQADRGLPVDGIVGPHTRAALPQTNQRTRPTRSRPSRPSAPKTTPAAPGRTPPTAPTKTNTNHGPWWLLIAAAALAAGLALLAVALHARRHRSGAPPQPTPAPERHTDDDTSQQTTSHTSHTSDTPDHTTTAEETGYLIDDPRTPAAIRDPTPDGDTGPSGLGPDEKVIGYITLAPDEHSSNADDPARRIAAACDRAGWHLTDVITDRQTGRGLQRPGLTHALHQIADHHATGLVISDLRRVSRSIIDLGALMEWFRDAHAALIALQPTIDTTTTAGQDLAGTLIRLGRLERERITNPTRTAPAEARTQDQPTARPAVSDVPELAARITTMQANGLTLQAIADQLNHEQIPTPRGGRTWQPSSVQAALGHQRPNTHSPRDQLPTTSNDHHQ
jgi:peptidoglycan hydrolase-like protein with peptidoglycan-binding domain/DNA invertase Pin-like site-specific DNA recombinase